MEMNLKRRLSLMIVPLVLCVVAIAAAKSKDVKEVLVHYDALVAGSHLASGEYGVTWQAHSPAATVSFLQKGKVVTTAEGKVVDRGTKCRANEVVYGIAATGAHEIQEIRFRGSTEVIVFSE
jgi:hypothetical protein